MKSLVVNVVKAYDFLTIRNDETTLTCPMEATGRALRFGLCMSVATIGLFLIGGSLAPLESASVSHGMIMPSNYKKTVQHLEGGIIDAIMVRDGDQVVEGQPLVRLSKIGASASEGVASTQFFTSRITQARLEALQEGRSEMTLDKALKADSDANPQLQDILASQQRLFAADRAAQVDKLAIYDQQIAQLHEEKVGLQARLKSSQAQLGFLTESLETERDLVERGMSTRPRLLALESQAEELRGKVGEITAAIGKNEKGEMEIAARISNEKNEFKSRIAEASRNANEASIELEKKRTSASDILDRTVITAPISGTVNDLKYHTVGGVIPSGSTIMDIVPKEDLVLVDAEVQPRDISRVQIGQDAKIMFSTYKSRTTPMVAGKVVQISADRIMPPASASMPSNGYYLARVEISKTQLQSMANPVTLTPGMPVEVMVVDGKRSLLGYYIKPFLDSFHRAFREQ